PLSPPAHGGIPVAFVLSQDAVVIDFAGPWEVFNNVHMSGSEPMPFHTYTVAETLNPIVASGGMKIMPNYTFQSAPPPKVIVIPAQGGTTEAMLAWIRKATKTTDVTMSVCTGAFVLAKTGLLSGKSATTFHGAFADFEKDYPDIHLKRGARFVEEGNLATAGGLSSGIDLAIRVVERYFGRHTAEQTAYTLEYQGKRVDGSEFERDLCQAIDSGGRRWAPAVSGMRDGWGREHLVGLQGQELLLLHAGAQGELRRCTGEVHQRGQDLNFEVHHTCSTYPH
ncbi:MAG: Transcriptional regulator containing an amidase domain and an AraC-type DNA-binding domain, partial [Acidobacteriaceae bacterium]|nr:Transcriptional regulator containing an amidase domain and an AraC-type DNA-binding domain [Acidobacteriaceae bacterium]